MFDDAVAIPGSGDAQPHSADEGQSARIWVRVLASYREPFSGGVPWNFLSRSSRYGAWSGLSVSYPLAVALAVLNGGFLVRLFAIQHDCGHGSYFKSRTVNDWVGRTLGVLTLTP